MFAWWRELQKARAGLRQFNALPRTRRRIVFYSEGRGYGTYFAPVLEALRARGQEVLYVTSGEDDPLLTTPPPGLLPFYIGSGSVRTLFFVGLEADVLVTTTPDLETYYLKRSPHGVHYVYLHHSLVSTHMVYRPAAFDHFDTIFCGGPHHREETRAREKQAGLSSKRLVAHGYGRLDAILAARSGGPLTPGPGEPRQVLVAPSWGDDALLERHGTAAIAPLLDAGLRVVVRPHPRTLKLRPQVLAEITGAFGQHPAFRLDTDADSWQSLATSDLMVSDWSGAALEFALGLERPVLFVDVPRKCLNPAYGALGIEPLEVRIRDEIGQVVAPDRLGELGALAVGMCQQGERWQTALREARVRWVYNPGHSGAAAADHLLSLLEEKEVSRAA
jgi:YidC/Oxa1 family membrane protein insertase